MAKVTLKFPNRAEPVSVSYQLDGEQFSVTSDSGNYEGSLVLTGPGEGWLKAGGKILPFYLSQQQDELTLWLQGRTYNFNLVSPEARRGGGTVPGGVGGGDIKAPMPGTILKVLVQPGDSVEAHQPLVLMESMKMEMTLSAHEAAVVQEIHCAPNQLVEMGALLVKLETSPPA